MGRLDGKVAFVTGAARGQGRSHSVRLAEEGADIVAVDALTPVDQVRYEMPDESDLAETARLVSGLGRRVLARRADVRVRAELDAVVQEALSDLGPIDIVAANAGICPPGSPFWAIPEDEWDAVMDINLKGVWNTVSAVVPSMLESGRGGSIAITSSSAALTCTTNMADYNASKAGAVALARTMANELAPHGIRVNAICPAAVGTDMILNEASFRLFRPDLEHPTLEDAIPGLRSLHPLGAPYLEPVDVSNALLWLVSEEGRYVTGIALPVDLGWNNKAM